MTRGKTITAAGCGWKKPCEKSWPPTFPCTCESQLEMLGNPLLFECTTSLERKKQNRLSFIGSATRLRKSSVAMRPVVQPRPLVTSETGNHRGDLSSSQKNVRQCMICLKCMIPAYSRHFIISSQLEYP